MALLVGFRPTADPAAWLGFCGLLVLFTLATTWLAMFFGLLAKTAEGAGAFSYILILLIFISPSFVPTELHDAVRCERFADNQPMTPIIETMRSLLAEGTAGPKLGAPWHGPQVSLSSSTPSRWASIAAARLPLQPSSARVGPLLL